MMDDHFDKDPDAVLDYFIDWEDWLEPYSDTLASATWTLTGGIVEKSSSITDTVATIWLDNDPVLDEGTECTATCHIVTAAGREEDQTIYFTIGDK